MASLQAPEPTQGIAAPVPLPAVAPETVAPSAESDHACETLYIQNLNEKIKPDGKPTSLIYYSSDVCSSVIKSSLKNLFKTYGEVLDVVAHNNLRMRGQAFVSFASKDSASKALRDVQRFPLYSKPMVSSLVTLF